jgi:outer membrane immunogenic protein
MRIFALAILAITAFASAPAFSQENPLIGRTYVGVGYDHTQTGTINTGVVSGTVGYNFTPNFAVEGSGGIGVNDDNVAGVEIRTRGQLGAFAVGKAPVSDRVELLGRVGYLHQWVKAEAAGIEAESDDGSFAIGAGAQFNIDEANGIRFDYTRYTENDGADGLALSYIRKF